MNYTVDPTVFNGYWDLAVSLGCAFSVEVFLYGILLVLLSIAAHLLYRRTGPGRRILASAMSLMALLATAQLAVFCRMFVSTCELLHLAIEGVEGEFPQQSARGVRIWIEFNNLGSVSRFLLVTNNLVTDSLFVFRCFAIWGRNVRVVIAPILMLFTTTVLGYLATYEALVERGGLDVRVPYILGILTNIILIALTAGRIWWIRRDARVLSESASIRIYNTVIAIILESGAIYCFTVLVYVICISSIDSPLMLNVFPAAMLQIVNIVPTLIIVRVGLGRGFEDTVVSEHGRKAFPRARRAPLSTFELQAPAPSSIIDIRAIREDENVSLSEHGKPDYELHSSSQGPSGQIGFGTEVQAALP
ncbi:hypothetical protein B0H11DRAFT_2025631 [Mycena galericulata]|nr:hypothetical protein B0H11DRAFT_2025631 [Mycena galericulata]